MNKYYFLFTIILCSLSFVSYAQQDTTIIRLQKELTNEQVDSGKVKLLMDIAEHYGTTQPDSALKYYDIAISLGKKSKYYYGLCRADISKATLLNQLGRFEESLKLSEETLPLSNKITRPYPSYVEASVYNNIASTYNYTSRYELATEYYLRSANILEKNGDSLHALTVYSNMVAIYNSMKQYAKARAFGRKVIAGSRKFNDEELLMNALCNTGGAMAMLRQYDSATILLNESYAISKKRNDPYGRLSILQGQNYLFFKTGRLQALFNATQEFMSLAEAVQIPAGRAVGYFYLSRYYLLTKNYAAAKDSLQIAIDTVVRQNIVDGADELYLLRSDIALAEGNLTEYLRYRDMSDSVRDMLTASQLQKNTQEMETKYQTHKKEQQIKLQQSELKAQHLQNTVLGILLVALVVIGLLSWRTYRSKQKLLAATVAKLENEKQLTATQAVLKGQDEERTRLAKDLHDGLGGLLSGIKFSFSHMKDNFIMTPENHQQFERSMDMLDNSIRELRRVAHNMMPEALMKFGLDAALADMCDYTRQTGIDVVYQGLGLADHEPDKNVSVNAYRIIQELLNNAVKHAEASRIVVQVTRSDDQFSITVEDNGKGFDPKALNEKSGIGWNNIRNRVDYLRGQMDVHSEPGKGTSVFIEFTTTNNTL